MASKVPALPNTRCPDCSELRRSAALNDRLRLAAVDRHSGDHGIVVELAGTLDGKENGARVGEHVRPPVRPLRRLHHRQPGDRPTIGRDTVISPPSGVGTKTIVSSVAHEAPRPDGASARTCAAPPATGHLLQLAGCEKAEPVAVRREERVRAAFSAGQRHARRPRSVFSRAARDGHWSPERRTRCSVP